MVERDLAKVEVAGSSPVFRSETQSRYKAGFFFRFLHWPVLDMQHRDAPVVELVDTQDLKSCDPQRSYGFNSRLGHLIMKQL